MTQELVLIVLLSGLIGLIWVMTLAIWEGKHQAAHQESESSGASDDVAHGEGVLKHQTIAA